MDRLRKMTRMAMMGTDVMMLIRMGGVTSTSR